MDKNWLKFNTTTVKQSSFIHLIHDFRDSVPVRKLHACCYDMQNFEQNKPCW